MVLKEELSLMGSFFTWKCEGKGVRKKKVVLKEEWSLIGSSFTCKGKVFLFFLKWS